MHPMCIPKGYFRSQLPTTVGQLLGNTHWRMPATVSRRTLVTTVTISLILDTTMICRRLLMHIRKLTHIRKGYFRSQLPTTVGHLLGNTHWRMPATVSRRILVTTVTIFLIQEGSPSQVVVCPLFHRLMIFAYCVGLRLHVAYCVGLRLHDHRYYILYVLEGRQRRRRCCYYWSVVASGGEQSADNELSWVSASHRDKAQDAFIYVRQRPAGPDFKLVSFLSVGTKQQSRLKYSHSLMSIPFATR